MHAHIVLTGRAKSTMVVSAFGRGDRVVECAGFENRKVPPSSGDPVESYESDSENLAYFLALLGRKWSELAELVMEWPNVPEALRAGIMAMVRSAK
jgi:hypothetical protein